MCYKSPGLASNSVRVRRGEQFDLRAFSLTRPNISKIAYVVSGVAFVNFMYTAKRKKGMTGDLKSRGRNLEGKIILVKYL
jgi:hypothetical protein